MNHTFLSSKTDLVFTVGEVPESDSNRLPQKESLWEVQEF